MSQFTDYAENAIVDYWRGQTLTLPANWYVAPLSAASDAGVTEVTGSGVARVALARSLANWSGTQGAGTTLASSGTSHVTSNNVAIDMGTALGAYGTVTHIGLFDASSGGNCWAWIPMATAIVTANSVAVSVAIGEIALTLGITGGMTDYLANKMIDLIFRGQAYAWPATVYLAALTAAPNNAGGGTEVGGGVGYARVAIVPSLTSLSGTQGAGTTAASSGTGGRISNNATLSFPTPTGAWGTVGWYGLNDALSAGNPLFWGAGAGAKTVGVGAPLSIAPDDMGMTLA